MCRRSELDLLRALRARGTARTNSQACTFAWLEVLRDADCRRSPAAGARTAEVVAFPAEVASPYRQDTVDARSRSKAA